MQSQRDSNSGIAQQPKLQQNQKKQKIIANLKIMKTPGKSKNTQQEKVESKENLSKAQIPKKDFITETPNYTNYSMSPQKYTEQQLSQKRGDTNTTDSLQSSFYYRRRTLRHGGDFGEDLDQKMDQIRHFHKKIMNYVQNIEGHIDSVLQKQESEFEVAFKGHCFHVKNEVKMLKKLINDLESMQKINQQIKDLQDKLEFCQNEANNYSLMLEEQKKVNDILRAKVDNINQEKNFLEQNLKSLKKENRYLQQALVNFQSQEQLSLTQHYSITPSNQKHQDTSDDLILTNEQSIQKKADDQEKCIQREGESITSTRPRSLDYRSSRIFQNQQRQFEFLQLKYKNLLNSRTQVIMQKSDLENLFLESVNEVKKMIAKRKKIKHQEINFKDFRNLDKQIMLELFLTNELVVSKVYEDLFPHRAPQPHQEQDFKIEKSQSKKGGNVGLGKLVKQGKMEPIPPTEKEGLPNIKRMISPRVEKGVLLIKTNF